MRPHLAPILNFDDLILRVIYSSTRADEMAFVPWTDEQKSAFLEMQFQAQHQYYLSRYPNASYNTIILENETVGRLYVDRNETEFKILDITILPEFRNRGIGTKLIEEILYESERTGKPVQIYIESYNSSSNLFARLGFSVIAEEGIYFLWQRKPTAEAEVIDSNKAMTVG